MTTIYPQITIERIKYPSKWYAIPLFGFLYKALIVAPVGIELMILSCARFLFSMLNSCNIFFRGRYWKMAYQLNLGIMRLETNVSLFLWGLSDVYPGFSLDTTDYQLAIDFNKTPNRVLATPFFGMLFRLVLMIPYLIYRHVLSTAAFLAVFVSWAVVLFAHRYPETTFEIARDSIRIDQAATAYFLGLSDTYPSWWMSFRHKALKILLLVLAALITLWSFTSRNTSEQRKTPSNYYQHSATTTPNSYNY